jgi:pheromone alpha factor receptor
MSSNNTTTGGPPPPGPPTNFNPLDQVSTLLYSDGVTPIPFNTMLVTDYYLSAISLSIEYGSQIGANFIMLCVVLAMTPRTRFRRLPTLLSIASLAINTARMALLAVFFVTPWLDLYVIISGDATFVPRSAFNLSAAATTLSVPVNVLILWALGLQAWSMTKLWRARVKIPAMGVSVVLILLTVTFSMMTTIIQTRAILFAEMPKESLVWVRQVYLAFITTAICWFCFLFNIRLVVHMWTNRTILPSLKGLKAMDVLVITNGVLMFVPGTFPHPSQQAKPPN